MEQFTDQFRLVLWHVQIDQTLIIRSFQVDGVFLPLREIRYELLLNHRKFFLRKPPRQLGPQCRHQVTALSKRQYARWGATRVHLDEIRDACMAFDHKVEAEETRHAKPM